MSICKTRSAVFQYMRGILKRYRKRNLWPMKTAKTWCKASKRFVWWTVIHSMKISVVLLALVKGQKILNAPRIAIRYGFCNTIKIRVLDQYIHIYMYFGQNLFTCRYRVCCLFEERHALPQCQQCSKEVLMISDLFGSQSTLVDRCWQPKELFPS